MSSRSFIAGPVRGIQLLVRLYPWSVLWVLLAATMVLVVTGSWLAIGLLSLMVLAVTYHSIRRDQADQADGEGDDG